MSATLIPGSNAASTWRPAVRAEYCGISDPNWSSQGRAILGFRSSAMLDWFL